MCGISGWVDWKRDLLESRSVISAMTEAMAPRGPDAQEVWISPHAALGHRRLAVIDIEGGQQPMRRSVPGGGTAVITFSGEIYNFHELRSQLRSHGRDFTTHSDTEVLLTAYLHWGTDFVHRLNGMYAFAIWDERKQELLLVRDRLGIKPLYYALLDGGVVFGSEPKALLAHPGITAEVDREGLAELLALPRARTPGHAVYRSMREVRPGCLVRGNASGLREERYWRLSAQPHTAGFDDTVTEVRALLEDIVRRQSIADVPVGTLLSGGIDSSIVTALAARELTAGVESFSVRLGPAGRPGGDSWRPSDDEPFASLAAEYLGIERHVTEVGAADLVKNLDQGLLARDLPGWGDLDTSMYHLFQGVRGRCTVALSGEAADEVFGGYAWQTDRDFVAHPSFPWMHGGRQPAALLRDDVRAMIAPERYEADRYRQALDEVPRLPGESGPRRREREVFHLGMTHWLGALLDRKDRMSMAVGLEVRVPFADHRLAEYLFNVPMELKARGGTEKAILRRACADLLPAEIVERPKSAYPASRDSAYLERLRELALDLLNERDAPVFALLDREKVRSAVVSDLDRLPGPITAITPAIGLSYLLQLNRWLEIYRVRVVL
ncbi:asparagine synthase (glutamine-hydrolyzing) [Streptomyces sp. NBC_01178]|uniref:asparagine synthase (glutamine-hydrolyzing) n=1 Tax=Streptomyces sp. NBC_01178 TaxID=2903762 RepID=UPI003863357F|nr:asparagine synthase (glutamine-hydrolyzing) [Streptomyces sp. NBC_01178]